MNDRRPLVRVAIYEPYPMGLGGNFLTQRLILERLDRERFQPVVIAPLEGAALDRFRRLGVDCVVMPPPGALGAYGGATLRADVFGRLKSAIDLVRYNLRISRFLKERKIDVIYSNCVRAQMSVGLGAKLAGVPSLMYVKGELANPIIDRLSIASASKVLFFSDQNRDDQYRKFLHWFRRKVDVLKIGLDPAPIKTVTAADLSALRKELNLAPPGMNAIVLAQLYRPKGQHFAIDALARVVKKFPDARLYLVGDHVIEEYRPYRAELEALIASRGLTGKVTFTGWRSDALEIVSLMDIVLHPSLSEGFGRAVLESMALGKPVVASSVGGLREAISDGQNGFLITPSDVDALASRWLELLESAELRDRLGTEAKRTVFSEYLIDDKIAALADIWAAMAETAR
jgi:glycosyltransferase involved in cell wall biosynthesis